jgi:predicted DNA-binding transcriptional regulator
MILEHTFEWEVVSGEWLRYTIYSTTASPIHGLRKIESTVEDTVAWVQRQVDRLNDPVGEAQKKLRPKDHDLC